MSNLPLLDQTLFYAINSSEETIEQILDCQTLFFYGEIRSAYLIDFRNFVEELVERCGSDKKETISICLTTPGGEAEAVEKMVDIIRHHYNKVYFLIPASAFSAGTIFCMSGDKIFMDYSSSLGPIDPQVPDRENKYLVPALGHLDKVKELIQKSKDGTIAPGELAILVKQDLAMLRFYEQARDLSVALLKDWLTRYKFADWTQHSTTNKGAPVTQQEKEKRAEDIAKQLSDNGHWHSHGRMIGMKVLQNLLKLKIDDFGDNKDLSRAVRMYNDTLTDYLRRQGLRFYLHNRRVDD